MRRKGKRRKPGSWRCTGRTCSPGSTRPWRAVSGKGANHELVSTDPEHRAAPAGRSTLESGRSTPDRSSRARSREWDLRRADWGADHVGHAGQYSAEAARVRYDGGRAAYEPPARTRLDSTRLEERPPKGG